MRLPGITLKKPQGTSRKTLEFVKWSNFQRRTENRTQTNQPNKKTQENPTLKDSVWLRKQKFRWQNLPSWLAKVGEKVCGRVFKNKQSEPVFTCCWKSPFSSSPTTDLQPTYDPMSVFALEYFYLLKQSSQSAKTALSEWIMQDALKICTTCQEKPFQGFWSCCLSQSSMNL